MLKLDRRQAAVVASLMERWGAGRTVVIGAEALACWIDMDWRRTFALDLAIMATGIDVPAELASMGFERHRNVEHRWREPTGVSVDVLAVTPRQLSSGKATWPQTGITMNLLGLDLALKHRVLVDTQAGQKVAVAPAPAVAFMKMAAWLDRPWERAKDVHDLLHMMACYLGPDDMRRWEDTALGTVDYEDQSTVALGMDMGKLARPGHRELFRQFAVALPRHPHVVASAAPGRYALGDRENKASYEQFALLGRSISRSRQTRRRR